MTVWSRSKMETFHAEGSYTLDCEARIDGDEITVTYRDEGVVEYSGRELSPGHFILMCPARNGRATLH